MLGKFTTVTFVVKFTRESPKTLVFRNALKAEREYFRSSISRSGPGIKMAKTKKDTNTRLAVQRKQTKERAAEQLCLDNIPMGLNESNDSSILDSTDLRVSVNIAVKFPIFYRRTLLFF